MSSKLVWLDYDKRSVCHLDLREIEREHPTQGRLEFALKNCRCFTIREPLATFGLESYRDHGISIEEVPEDSVLRTKKIPEEHDGDMSLVQFTTGSHGVIYNLQAQNRYEVAVIGDLQHFTDPISF